MDVIREILMICDGPVSLEVIRTDAEGMFEEGRKLAELGEQVVIKIPMTLDGDQGHEAALCRGNRRQSDTRIFTVTSAYGCQGRRPICKPLCWQTG